MVRFNVVCLAKRQDRITAKEQKIRLYKVLKRSWRREEQQARQAEERMDKKKKSELREADHAEEVEAGGKFEKQAIRDSKRASLFGEDGEEDLKNFFKDENFKFEYKPRPKQPPCWWKSAYGFLPRAGDFADLKNVDGVFRLVEEGRIDTRAPFLYQHFLQKCIQSKALEQGQKVHAHIVRSGLSKDRNFSNMLVEMYGACGQIEDAVKVFNSISDKNTVSYNVMISAYTLYGDFRKALDIYNRMDAVEPDDHVLATALTAAASLKSLDEGKAIHKRILDSGLKPDLMLENAILNMYAKCEDMIMAEQIFKGMSVRNSTTWGILISGYIHCGDCSEAIKLYKRIQHGVHSVELNNSTMVLLIGACASLGLLEEGREIHESMAGKDLSASVASALMNLYANLGRVEDARDLFEKLTKKDLVAWNTMIEGYARNGELQQACELYHKLLISSSSTEDGSSSIRPDKLTFCAMLGVFAELGDLEEGKRIRKVVDQSQEGLASDLRLQNAFLNLYGKCGAVEEAKQMFDRMWQKDSVSWTAMINAYTHSGNPEKAIDLFRRMDVDPSAATYASAVYACSVWGNLREGKALDEKIATTEFKADLGVQNALVSMYARGGELMYAKWEFDRIPSRNCVSWNTLLGAYAQSGRCVLALEMIPLMLLEGVQPDAVTMTVILCCCSELKVVKEGWERFVWMGGDFGIEATVEHYGCFVHLLGKDGKLEEAEELLKTMPFEAGREQWKALLDSCKSQGDSKRWARSAYRIMDLK